MSGVIAFDRVEKAVIVLFYFHILGKLGIGHDVVFYYSSRYNQKSQNRRMLARGKGVRGWVIKD